MRILTKHQQFVIVSPMSNNETIQELGNESSYPLLQRAAAALLVGAAFFGAGYAAKQGYESMTNIQPSAEQIYDSIVGPSHG